MPRRAFDRKGRRIGYTFGLNFNAEEFSLNKKWGPDENRNYKWKPNASFEYSESFLNQRFGVLFGISRANSYTEQYSFSNGLNRNPTAADPRPGRSLEHAETHATILRMIDRLPPNQQEVVRLKFQNGFSYKEISRITALSVSNVGFLIHTAVARLRTEFAAQQP